MLRDEVERRLKRVNALKATRDRSTDDARDYVEAMLDFEVYSDHAFRSLSGAGHSHRKNTEPDHDG